MGRDALKSIDQQAADLANSFRATGADLDTELLVSLNAAAILVEGAAVLKIHNVTGQTAKSVDHRVEKTPTGGEGQTGSNVEWMPYLEFGTGIYAEDGNGRKTPWVYQDSGGKWHYTRGMKPQHILTDSLNENKREVESIVRAGMKRMIDKAGK